MGISKTILLITSNEIMITNMIPKKKAPEKIILEIKKRN